MAVAGGGLELNRRRDLECVSLEGRSALEFMKILKTHAHLPLRQNCVGREPQSVDFVVSGCLFRRNIRAMFIPPTQAEGASYVEGEKSASANSQGQRSGRGGPLCPVGFRGIHTSERQTTQWLCSDPGILSVHSQQPTSSNLNRHSCWHPG
jgi:hypothetical protein